MSSSLALADVARLPAPGDNCAVATRRLDVGTLIDLPGNGPRALAHTVLLGHRFAARTIARGAELLSWGMPFGVATRDIAAGEYVCNKLALEAFAHRELPGVVLPREHNFDEVYRQFVFDDAGFRSSPQVAPVAIPRTFHGYRRPGRRGVGTRNYLVVLGTSSRTGALARSLAARLQTALPATGNLDGIVPVAHTEGAGPGDTNNRAELLRTLAGFMVHANVASVLALDAGDEAVNNAALRAFMEERGYPLADVPHAWLSIGASPAEAFAQGEAIVRAWIPIAAAIVRSEEPLAALKIGMQCGGSDAFSGISANPLLAQVTRELIRHGGAVNQAETDELIGAEAYFIRHARDAATARGVLAAIERFKERLSWHGASAEGNPSGGNRLRGLYNIVLKSLGAAAKKAPDVRIDQVIDYAEPMAAPGFTFMDSPGNDLESVAGQVGAGCNLIMFTTGNGSITNFPFVPTIKLTSTTTRHELLVNEMDVNAGAYLDGTPMEELTARTFDFTVRVASGERTKGERAGHSQVSIWRNWRQTRRDAVAAIAARSAPDGIPLPVRTDAGPAPDVTFEAWPAATGERACDRVGLIIPASLCASQIARLAAERLNASGLAARHGLSRFVALVHTEGCGFTGETLYARLTRTYAAYATHPHAAATLFLEHGCEKVPNDAIRNQLVRAAIERERFGWASVQLDGGIEKVLAKVEAWFQAELARRPEPLPFAADLSALRLGLLSAAPVTTAGADMLARLVRAIVAAGGSVLVPENDPLLRDASFVAGVCGDGGRLHATLEWAQRPERDGFHVVRTETDHWTENLAGIGACGVHAFLGVTDGSPRPGHPMLPVVEVAGGTNVAGAAVDFVTAENDEHDAGRLLRLIVAAATRRQSTAAERAGNMDFQITRGLLGVST